MTNQEINHVIAEFCGYKFIAFNKGWITSGDAEIQINIPDYCNDLNAMHEAEKTLSKEQCNIYSDYLALTPQSNEWASCTMWHFKASQRAEAFLKTIGKWKE